MLYERIKQVGALASAIAITITLYAYIANFKINMTISLTIIAALIAALTAFISISFSRKLRTQRESNRIFLIYSRDDLDKVKQIVGLLKEKGFNPWLDVEEIMPGDIWKDTILRAIERSSIALVIISENFIKNKGFAQKELQMAQELLQEKDKGKSPVIPVRLENVEVPEQLSHINWVDLFEKEGAERLEKGLNNFLKLEST